MEQLWWAPGVLPGSTHHTIKRKMRKPLGAFCCPVLLYKHLELADGPLELFCEEAACPAAVISSYILQVPESRPGI